MVRRVAERAVILADAGISLLQVGVWKFPLYWEAHKTWQIVKRELLVDSGSYGLMTSQDWCMHKLCMNHAFNCREFT